MHLNTDICKTNHKRIETIILMRHKMQLINFYSNLKKKNLKLIKLRVFINLWLMKNFEENSYS